MNVNYDIIIIGAGHAGVEAALICAKKNKKVGLINLSEDKIATMPCNPSIGGPAKGNIVREIDALGGFMAKAADATYLQMKLLNISKGPAVRALRAQIDKIEYSKFVANEIKNNKNIKLIVGMVENIIIENNEAKGVTINNKNLYSKIVILTTGTYMSSLVLRGKEERKEGPDGDKTTYSISKQLFNLGFKLIRLKTGTPPRIDFNSIDFEDPQISKEPGTNMPLSFSFMNKRFININKQAMCWLIYSNEQTKEIVEKNITLSPMYFKVKKGTGPRYCPSFEDKIIRFNTKNKHQIFLEPESIHLNTIYIQGFSTSMPKEIQLKMLHTLPGLKKCKVIKWAYAIEYDAIESTQLFHTLETKIIKNLYCAGQINGTSGYEEAACQGLIAGINASLKLENKKPFILKRSDAYIGVLIDDIVSKKLFEPYRMLTSRAEYRLILRNDNAEDRLKKLAYDIGLISENEWKYFLNHLNRMNKIKSKLSQIIIKPNDELATFLINNKISPMNNPISALNLLKRPEIELEYFSKILPEINNLTHFEKENLIINIKFEGYVKKQEKDIKKFIKLERKKIPVDINYDKIPNLANEAREKLKLIKPISIGQATRILGINPSDIQMLIFYLKNNYKK